MAGEYLFDQAGAGSGETDDEDRPPRVEARPGEPREIGRIDRLDQTRNQALVVGWIVPELSPPELAIARLLASRAQSAARV